jgi:hypothetical protein
LEFKILSPKDGVYAMPINFNFDELKHELTARLSEYQGLVFTDNNIGEAKDIRAKLNKLRTVIDEKRKEVKRQCMEPYEAFEKQVKEVLALIDAPIMAIDGQVKSYEQTKKDEKRAAIFEYYNDHVRELADLLPLERIFNDKWLNATFKMKDITDSIDASITRVESDLQTIAELGSEFELQIKDAYLRTLDLSAALNEKTRLEQQKAKLAEFEAKKTEEPKVIGPGGVDFKDLKPGDRVQFAPTEETVHEIDFRVWATSAQLNGLKAYLKLNNIKFGRVPEGA